MAGDSEKVNKNIFSLNKGIVSLEGDIPSRDYIN